jgi:hypothetical protein
VHGLEHAFGDLQQFVVGVVREGDVVRDAAAQARVALEEGVHAVLVAGQDHDQVVALVLHHLQQDLDRLLTVVALVLGPVQVVGLVDEEHAAHRLLEHFARLGCGVADVLADQVVAGHRHQVALSHVAQAMQDLGHAQRHGGLAGARVAGEAHVQAGRLRLQAHRPAQPVDHQQRRDVADALLDRRQADQVALQVGQHRLDLAVAQHLGHGARGGMCRRNDRCSRRAGGSDNVVHGQPRGAAGSGVIRLPAPRARSG